MSILLMLIPLGLVLLGLAIWAFVWAVNHGQFEDLDRAGHSILFDDDLEGEGSQSAESRSSGAVEPSREEPES